MKRWLVCIAFGWTLAVSTATSHAQGGTSTAHRTQVVNACKQAATEVLQKMRPMLDALPTVPKTKDLVLFRPDIVFSAEARYETRRIELTYGTCHEIFMLTQALAYASVIDPSAALEVEAYGKLVTTAYTEASKQSAGGDLLWVDLPQFPAWLGRNDTISQERAFMVDRMTEDMLFDSLAHMLGHELAHLALPHSASLKPPDSRIQEAQADKLGMRLTQPVLRLPGNPILLVPIFALMNREYPLRENLESEHPHSACRIAYASKQLRIGELQDRSDYPPLYRQHLATKLDEARSKTGLLIKSLGEIYDNVLQLPMCMCYRVDCKISSNTSSN